MNKYKKKVKQKNRYREYIRVLNGVLQLTEREIDVLSVLMELDEDWPTNRLDQKNIYSTDSRKHVMQVTNVNKTNLTKYSARFIELGIISKDESGKATVTQLFKARNNKDTYEVVFILDFKED